MLSFAQPVRQKASLAVIVALASFLWLAVTAASAGVVVDRAVDGLQSQPVYVDPSAERTIDDAEAARIAEQISS